MKLKLYQNEHKTLQEKTQFMIARSGPTQEPVAPMGNQGMYVKSGIPDRSRFFTPQVKQQAETFPQQMASAPKPFAQSEAQTVKNLHQEYQNILQNY